jgi:CxxC motif-containing protein (DUF1111 family)
MTALGTSAAVAALILLASLSGCDTFFTEAPPPGETFDQPLEGLTREQGLAFALGDEAFERTFAVADGLGPIFNNTSCEGCHPGDGKSHPVSNLTRFGRIEGGVFDPLLDAGGPQLQNRSIRGVRPELIPAHANAVSVRSGPVAFGLGLVEMIPDDAILSRADPADLNGDGISGVPNFVTAPEWAVRGPGPYPGGTHLGRFGRKAGAATLIQQIATAYHQDIGITTDFIPLENPHPVDGLLGDAVADPELPAADVSNVLAYLRMLAPPARGGATPQTARGEVVFDSVGCGSCHTPVMTTGTGSPIAALNDAPVQLYSDMLLHDMGGALADGFIEHQAGGREWRTTPLWGLRLFEAHLGGTAYYLHDGRTSDLREAITLHGGEAEQTTTRFLNLPPGDVEALLAFLKTL